MNYIVDYRNAQYINESGWVDCEIDHPEYGWIPYTLNPQDEESSIDNSNLLTRMLESNSIAPFVPPTQQDLHEKEAEGSRAYRDNLLQTEVDPIVTNPLRWAELTLEKQQEWLDYRLALLSVPEQSGFPFHINWPTKPK